MEKRSIHDIATTAMKYVNSMQSFLKSHSKTLNDLLEIPKYNAEYIHGFSSEYIFNMFYIGKDRHFTEWVDMYKVDGEVTMLHLRFNFEIGEKSIDAYISTEMTIEDVEDVIIDAILHKITEFQYFLDEANNVLKN